MQFGSNPTQLIIYHGAQFLKEELPVRLAHRAVELSHLPHGLDKMQSVELVRNWYIESFNDLSNFKATVGVIPEKFLSRSYFESDKNASLKADLKVHNDEFSVLISEMKRKHASTTQKLAAGVMVRVK